MLELTNAFATRAIGASNLYDEWLRQQASRLTGMQFQSPQTTIKNIDAILQEEKLLLLIEE